MQLSKKERKVIVIILIIIIAVTLLFPLLSHIHFLAVNYFKFYKAFPIEQIMEIEYEIELHHLSHSILAITGLPLLFSVPAIDSYGGIFSGDRAAYAHSLIPFIILKWIPWVSIPISYRLTSGIVKWRRVLYIYLIATYLGILNMTLLFGASSFDIFVQI